MLAMNHNISVGHDFHCSSCPSLFVCSSAGMGYLFVCSAFRNARGNIFLAMALQSLARRTFPPPSFSIASIRVRPPLVLSAASQLARLQLLPVFEHLWLGADRSLLLRATPSSGMSHEDVEALGADDSSSEGPAETAADETSDSSMELSCVGCDITSKRAKLIAVLPSAKT